MIPAVPPTADAALKQHGYTWDRLEKLAWRALHDEMRHRRILLDPDRLQEAHEHLVDVGAAWAIRYDTTKAHEHDFVTSCYRRMRPRLIDYLRHRHGDQRRGNPLTEIATATLPESAQLDTETFEQAVEKISGGLTTRALWTLRHIAKPIAVNGITLSQAASLAGITRTHADELLEELGWQLGRAPTADLADTDLAELFVWATA